MSFVSVDEYQRFGERINGDMHALDDNVDRTGANVLGGPWWQNWKGFIGSWSQYYESNVHGFSIPIMSVLPIHDDSDLHDWAAKLDSWRAEYATLSKVKVGPLSTQETNQQIVPGLSDITGINTSSPWLKVGLVVIGVLGVGFIVHEARSL